MVAEKNNPGDDTRGMSPEQVDRLRERVMDRLESLEHYKAAHDAQIKAFWKEQWKINSNVDKRASDFESRLRQVERGFAKWVGAGLTVSGFGAALGAFLASRMTG